MSEFAHTILGVNELVKASIKTGKLTKKDWMGVDNQKALISIINNYIPAKKTSKEKGKASDIRSEQDRIPGPAVAGPRGLICAASRVRMIPPAA